MSDLAFLRVFLEVMREIRRDSWRKRGWGGCERIGSEMGVWGYFFRVFLMLFLILLGDGVEFSGEFDF